MKSMLKLTAGIATAALIGTAVFAMQDDKTKKKVSRKAIKAMDDVEHALNKKFD